MIFHTPLIPYAGSYKRQPRERPLARWTEERVATLESLWADGNSASVIADLLGNGFTRNAVIGKVHRLGLARLCGVVKLKKAERVRRQRPSKRVIYDTRLKNRQVPATAPAVLTREKSEAPASMRLTVLQLEDMSCRWPGDDHPLTTFCGHDHTDDSPYCPTHHALAYRAGTQKDFDRIAARTMGGQLHASKTFIAE